VWWPSRKRCSAAGLVRRLRAGAGPGGQLRWALAEGQAHATGPGRVPHPRRRACPAQRRAAGAELPADAFGVATTRSPMCRPSRGSRPTRAAAWCWTRARPCPACARRRSTRCAPAAGSNQRMALWDGILIKENHIAAAGGIAQALQAAQALRAGVSSRSRSKTWTNCSEALQPAQTSVLLDDFTLDDMHERLRGERRPRRAGSVGRGRPGQHPRASRPPAWTAFRWAS
jgi:nicotinate-nucleotide pyrophosphorylase (carboxylating)